jgi:hypothetical protein
VTSASPRLSTVELLHDEAMDHLLEAMTCLQAAGHKWDGPLLMVLGDVVEAVDGGGVPRCASC